MLGGAASVRSIREVNAIKRLTGSQADQVFRRLSVQGFEEVPVRRQDLAMGIENEQITSYRFKQHLNAGVGHGPAYLS
jgi:hypothetical protein